jgi:hypothetical protein
MGGLAARMRDIKYAYGLVVGNSEGNRLFMNCLRQLEHWGRGLGFHSRHKFMCVFILFVLSCVYVVALRRADPPSKESYRLCIGLRY